MAQQGDYYKNAIEKLFLIVNKDAKTVPFTLNEPQTKILYNLTGRDIVLKARQEGISSLILALFTIDFLMKENVRCVVISHEANATQKLLDRVKYYLESLKTTFPGALPYKLKYNSRSELLNEEKNSVFYIGTAGSRAFGRGDTIQNLHVSELPFYPDQETVMTGLMQAVPTDGRIIIEATANGVGDYFYNLWNESKKPGSTFTNHFLPWFAMKEYQRHVSEGFQPNEEEQELQKTFNLTHEQLNWRRHKLSELQGDIDKLNQEFPSTAEEAFILSGNPVWSPTLMQWYLHGCKEPKFRGNLMGAYQIFFETNEKGNLQIWEEPNPSHSYVIGADPAEGISSQDDAPGKRRRLDSSCAVVFDRNTAEVVAVWHGDIAGDMFGRQLDLLGRYYQNAFIGVEKNFQGLAPLLMLRDLNYPHIYYREKIGRIGEKMTDEMGWRTDRFTRPMMVEEASKWLRERRLNIYDKDMVAEMMSFVRWPDGQARAEKGSHDDRILALMIAIQMYIRNPATERGNEIEREAIDVYGMGNEEGENIMSGGDVY